MSAIFGRNVKCKNFEGDCVPNGTTGKVAALRVLNFIHENNMHVVSDKMQIFLKEWSVSSLMYCCISGCGRIYIYCISICSYCPTILV